MPYAGAVFQNGSYHRDIVIQKVVTWYTSSFQNLSEVELFSCHSIFGHI